MRRPWLAFSGSSYDRQHQNPKNCCENATHTDNIYRNSPNA